MDEKSKFKKKSSNLKRLKDFGIHSGWLGRQGFCGKNSPKWRVVQLPNAWCHLLAVGLPVCPSYYNQPNSSSLLVRPDQPGSPPWRRCPLVLPLGPLEARYILWCHWTLAGRRWIRLTAFDGIWGAEGIEKPHQYHMYITTQKSHIHNSAM